MQKFKYYFRPLQLFQFLKLSGSFLSKMNIDEQLINAVRENEVVYNKFSKSYKNIALKGEIWKKIGTALGISDHECTTRWKSLRDKYMREKKLKENKPSGSACISKPEWYLFNEMNFLSDFVKPRKTTGNYTEIVGEGVEAVLHESDVFEFGDISTSTELFDVLDDQPNTSYSNASPAPKKRKDTCINNIEQQLTGTMTALKTFIEKKDSSNSNIIKRVDILLEGLRKANRDIAEKKLLNTYVNAKLLI